jgi:predicted phage tail protein
MRTIHLHGALGVQFGERFEFEVETAGEALRAFNCAFPGAFIKALEGNTYRVVRGDIETGMDLDLDLVNQFKLGNAELHLIPVAEGAMYSQRTKGTAKLVLGAALVGGAIFFSGGTLAAPLAGLATPAFGIAGMSVTWGNIALVGLGLALAGVSTLLTKPASPTASNDVSAQGAATGDLGQQGAAIPLIYGEVLTQAVPISVVSTVEDIPVYSDQYGSIEAAFNHFWYGYQ